MSDSQDKQENDPEKFETDSNKVEINEDKKIAGKINSDSVDSEITKNESSLQSGDVEVKQDERLSSDTTNGIHEELNQNDDTPKDINAGESVDDTDDTMKELSGKMESEIIDVNLAADTLTNENEKPQDDSLSDIKQTEFELPKESENASAFELKHEDTVDDEREVSENDANPEMLSGLATEKKPIKIQRDPQMSALVYIEQKQIANMFKDVTSLLLVDQPKDSVQYLKNYFQKIKDSRELEEKSQGK